MEFNAFTFFLTEDCNFNCSFCYQRKGTRFLKFPAVRKAVDFFGPYFKKNATVNFYGGEPLLAFGVLEKTLRYLQSSFPEKQIRFVLSTNGSLITEDILQVLDAFGFRVLLNFSPRLQKSSRKKTRDFSLTHTIDRIRGYPNIELETNSVFVPVTVNQLSRTITSLVKKGISATSFNLSYDLPWREQDLVRFQSELKDLWKYCYQIFEETGSIPVPFFEAKQGIGMGKCPGGKEGITLTPDERLWGCHLFFDYAKARQDPSITRLYSFGPLDWFVKDYEKIYQAVLENYSKVRIKNCRTSKGPCANCPDLLSCSLCPMAASFESAENWVIPPWVCSIKKIMWEENRAFWRRIEGW